jgi:hypothetical protein
MRKTLGVCSLVLLLTCSASAGIIQNEQPAPQPTPAAQGPTGGGTATGETPAGTADVLSQIVSDVFAVLPSLL